jgi:hypothetical protein
MSIYVVLAVALLTADCLVFREIREFCSHGPLALGVAMLALMVVIHVILTHQILKIYREVAEHGRRLKPRQAKKDKSTPEKLP